MQQIVKNILNSQVDSVLVRAKKEVRNEGKKKISEFQNQIPTPDSIIEKLKMEPNEDSCSEEGLKKMNDQYEKLKSKLEKIQNTVKSAIEKLESIENKVNPIIDETGPIGEILGFVDLLKNTLIPILKGIILAAPFALGPLVGLINSAAAADAITSGREKAKSKTAEYIAVIASVPLMILFYQKQAKKIINPLSKIKDKLKSIDDQITKLILFMTAQLFNAEDQCDDFNKNNIANDSVNNIFPDPNGPSELEEYMSFLNDNYKDVYNKLQESGNKKAIKRIFTLKENLEENYNISFKVINS
jgi:DNA repair exonuclease SbcCD ATPase subunit